MATQIEQVEDIGVNPAPEIRQKMGITLNFAHPGPFM
jgi:hypothetical protein|tara:strand:+ start:36 stop:146 length:111 start_codon:yes stop_codon:yes gene_type:complete